MQVDSDERYIEEKRPAGIPVLPLVLAILALAGIALWYFFGTSQDEPTAPASEIVPAAPVPAVPSEPAPDIPEPEPEPLPVATPSPEPNEPPPAPPLTLETSDEALREDLAPVFTADALAATLQSENLIERGTALVNAASQGLVLPKLFPLPPPEGKFTVREDGLRVYTNPESYRRYDHYAQAISAMDPTVLADTFHKFRPLLEQAYAALGYDAEDFDNALIRALDQVIAAPVLQSPALLEKDVTTYKYVDESLEALSPLAKQLMRMGPENQLLVQEQARALRKELLGR